MEKGGLTEYPLDMVQTAYRVELGELLQEWKQFKFWKLNKGEIDRDKMLEEWADCMHFALSLDKCNATGICENLCYISPKTGHAICETAGKPYHNKLLKMPNIWQEKII